MLKEINPSILAVTGRVREPSDQGSVEKMQKHIKSIRCHFETEARQRGQGFNWPDNLRKVMSAVKKACSRGKFETSPYKSVFGMDYDLLLSCLLEDLRACTTIELCLKLAPNRRLKHMARA